MKTKTQELGTKSQIQVYMNHHLYGKIRLQIEQEQFKIELENLNHGYEKIIDDASSQIEDFVNCFW